MMKNAWLVTCPERAREMTLARIGPTHGVQSSPSESPIISPPLKPVLFCPCGTNLENLAKRISSSF